MQNKFRYLKTLTFENEHMWLTDLQLVDRAYDQYLSERSERMHSNNEGTPIRGEEQQPQTKRRGSLHTPKPRSSCAFR